MPVIRVKFVEDCLLRERICCVISAGFVTFLCTGINHSTTRVDLLLFPSLSLYGSFCYNVQTLLLKQIEDTCRKLKYSILYVSIFGDLNV